VDRVEIDRLASGGDGVGRLEDGRVVFVPFAAPGDVLRVEIVERRKRHARARIVEIESPGPARRLPRCPVFGSCGGCVWQHLEYPAQLEAKRAILLDAVVRIGGLEPPGAVAMCGSPEEFGYRSRARVLATGGKVGFRRLRSHELEPIEHCPVLSPPVDRALADAARIGQTRQTRQMRPTGGLESRAARGERRAPRAGGGLAVEVEIAAGCGGVVRAGSLDPEALASGPPLELEVDGERLRVSPGVFTQANELVLPELCASVRREAGSGRRLAELFAGAGTFTLSLARRFDGLLAVESNARATGDLAFNLERAGLASRVEVRTQAVEQALGAIAAFEPELIVLDPPRSGLAPGCAVGVAGAGARRIVYVSCDPATLARDLRLIVEAGYRLVRLQGFDLFPQTQHVEALAVLDQR